MTSLRAMLPTQTAAAMEKVTASAMMSHMAPPGALAEQARLMESYGAHCVYVTDSGGRLTMDGVRDRVRAYRDLLEGWLSEGTLSGLDLTPAGS